MLSSTASGHSLGDALSSLNRFCTWLVKALKLLLQNRGGRRHNPCSLWNGVCSIFTPLFLAFSFPRQDAFGPLFQGKSHRFLPLRERLKALRPPLQDHINLYVLSISIREHGEGWFWWTARLDISVERVPGITHISNNIVWNQTGLSSTERWWREDCLTKAGACSPEPLFWSNWWSTYISSLKWSTHLHSFLNEESKLSLKPKWIILSFHSYSDSSNLLYLDTSQNWMNSFTTAFGLFHPFIDEQILFFYWKKGPVRAWKREAWGEISSTGSEHRFCASSFGSSGRMELLDLFPAIDGIDYDGLG